MPDHVIAVLYFLKKLANSFHKVYEDYEENLAGMGKVLQK